MLLGSTLLAASLLNLSPAVETAPAPAPFHCQVPCGIYGDHLRVELLREHATTIEKAMQQIEELGKAETPNWNQLVRWITTKDDHAQTIQDQLSDYWLAQRIKAPEEGAEDGSRRKYLTQLMQNHRMATSAMKCKQTTDVENVAAFREALDAFAGAYFSEEDLEHVREHMNDGGHGRDGKDGEDGGDGGHEDHDHDHDHDDHDHAQGKR